MFSVTGDRLTRDDVDVGIGVFAQLHAVAVPLERLAQLLLHGRRPAQAVQTHHLHTHGHTSGSSKHNVCWTGAKRTFTGNPRVSKLSKSVLSLQKFIYCIFNSIRALMGFLFKFFFLSFSIQIDGLRIDGVMCYTDCKALTQTQAGQIKRTRLDRPPAASSQQRRTEDGLLWHVLNI